MTIIETQTMKSMAQEVLDELFAAGRISFQLSARVIENTGYDEYIIRFHDSRLYFVGVQWTVGQSFNEIFRDAVLEQLLRTGASKTRTARTTLT